MTGGVPRQGAETSMSVGLQGTCLWKPPVEATSTFLQPLLPQRGPDERLQGSGRPGPRSPRRKQEAPNTIPLHLHSPSGHSSSPRPQNQEEQKQVAGVKSDSAGGERQNTPRSAKACRASTAGSQTDTQTPRPCPGTWGAPSSSESKGWAPPARPCGDTERPPGTPRAPRPAGAAPLNPPDAAGAAPDGARCHGRAWPRPLRMRQLSQ